MENEKNYIIHWQILLQTVKNNSQNLKYTLALFDKRNLEVFANAK